MVLRCLPCYQWNQDAWVLTWYALKFVFFLNLKYKECVWSGLVDVIKCTQSFSSFGLKIIYLLKENKTILRILQSKILLRIISCVWLIEARQKLQIIISQFVIYENFWNGSHVTFSCILVVLGNLPKDFPNVIFKLSFNGFILELWMQYNII